MVEDIDQYNILTFAEPNLTKSSVLGFVRKNYDLPGINGNSNVYDLTEKSPDADPVCSKVFVIEGRGERSNQLYLVKENIFEILNYDNVARELVPSLLEYLYQEGIKVLPLHRTRESSFQSFVGGHRVEIIDYIPNVRASNVPNKREDDIKVVARELARFHQAVKKYDPEMIEKFKARNDLYENGRVDATTGKEFLAELIEYEDFYSRSNLAQDSRIFAAFLTLREDYEQIKDLNLGSDSSQVELTLGINHRDTHSGNVLIHSETGEFMGFVDWDIVKYSPFIHDLAYSIDSFSSDRSNPFGSPDLKLAELFLNTYLREHSLPNEDIQNLFVPLRADMVDRTAIFMRANYRGDEEFRSNVVAAHVALQVRMRKLEKRLLHIQI